MKKKLWALFISFTCLIVSCSKSDNKVPVNSLDTQYKNLNSDNVTSFILDSVNAYRGCAGSNCSSVFDFYFKNLNYVSEISLGTYNRIEPIWSNYQKDKQYVRTYGQYSDNQYRLKIILKDGRAIFSPWKGF